MSPRLAVLIVLLCLAVAGALALVPASLPDRRAGAGDAFDARVRAYLMDHPEVIVDAVSVLQQRSQAARAATQRAAVRAHRAELEASRVLPTAGNPEGDVTVVEFFDYRCPYCKRARAELDGLIAADPGVRVVYREFPVLGPASTLAAKAAIAAARQGKYLPFHGLLMDHRGELDEAAVMATAAAAGLDSGRLRADMEDGEVAAEIARAHALARRLGIDSTPTFVIGDTLVPGYVDAATLRRLVAGAREAGRSGR